MSYENYKIELIGSIPKKSEKKVSRFLARERALLKAKRTKSRGQARLFKNMERSLNHLIPQEYYDHIPLTREQEIEAIRESERYQRSHDYDQRSYFIELYFCK